ncbi:MAG: AAA family ATPase [Desulfobacterium sp.]|nr:AAA family ATPase [Desulfobacterium sp.]
MVKKNRVSVLCGGPGTGKSTTLLSIIEWAASEKMSITQAAPTGKAAKRMMEATGHYASTIHTMLGCIFEDGKFQFAHNRSNPLQADLLILDEISMITNDLMCRVLEAIDPKRTKLLLVGDQDQLPSVGAGAVLRDILASQAVPHVELDVIHRNSGTIVTACHRIKRGQFYSPAKALDLEATPPVNLIHVECSTPEMTLAGVESMVCDRMPLRGYDPINDIQVLSPVNTKGLLSCKSINDRLRDRLNPDTDGLWGDGGGDDYPFRPGDKVINTKNSRLQTTKGAEAMIVNGDIGIVRAIHGKEIIINFTDPDREVAVPKKDKNLLHAYCITCHKFQGSEAPVIIIPVHQQFNYFLSNSWIYTAISRGKEIVITLGDFNTIEKAIKNRIPNNRKTKLAEQIVSIRQQHLNMEFEGI